MDILISTIDGGIENVKDVLLPFRNDVRYILSHQYQDKVFLKTPKELQRHDVVLSQIEGAGLTKSRNNAISLSTSDICVIADDDVRFTNEYFDTIFDAHGENNIDVGCFKIYTGEGKPEYKKYPTKIVSIKSLSSYWPSSIEITFKRKAIIEKKIAFDERFGLGSWLSGGEEAIFLMECIRKGCEIKFFPKYIVEHSFESKNKLLPKYDKRRIREAGAVDTRLHGYSAIPNAFRFTIKNLPELRKYKKNPIVYLRERLSGVFYILGSLWNNG